MSDLPAKFFNVSSQLREMLRRAVDGPLSLVEMRGLEFIAANPGARQKDLAAHWGITNASVSAFIAKMEKLGFIARARDPKDKRASVLKVTEAGQAAIARMQAAASAASEPFFAPLSADERVALEHILDKLKPQ